jgi:hypothetical protein
MEAQSIRAGVRAFFGVKEAEASFAVSEEARLEALVAERKAELAEVLSEEKIILEARNKAQVELARTNALWPGARCRVNDAPSCTPKRSWP